MGMSRWNQCAACWQISRELLESAVCLKLRSPSLTPSCSASLPAWSLWMCWWTPKRGICASAKGRHMMEKGVWKNNVHKWGKWGYWNSWFTNRRGFSPEGSSDHPEMAGAGEALENSGLDKGTEGTLSPPASHGSCVMCAEGPLPKPPAAVISAWLRPGQAGNKKELLGPGCSVCHRVSWGGGESLIPQGQGSCQDPTRSPAQQLHSLSHTSPWHPLKGRGCCSLSS